MLFQQVLSQLIVLLDRRSKEGRVWIGHILLIQHSWKKALYLKQEGKYSWRINSFPFPQRKGVWYLHANSILMNDHFHVFPLYFRMLTCCLIFRIPECDSVELYLSLLTAIAKKLHFSWENLSKDNEVARNKNEGLTSPPKKDVFFLRRSWTTQKITINYGQLATVLAYLIILKQVGATFYHTKSTMHSWKQE